MDVEGIVQKAEQKIQSCSQSDVEIVVNKVRALKEKKSTLFYIYVSSMATSVTICRFVNNRSQQLRSIVPFYYVICETRYHCPYFGQVHATNVRGYFLISRPL